MDRPPSVILAGPMLPAPRFLALTAVAFMLAACGRPDATGFYLSRSDRQVALVQLAETKDGAVAGRLEQASIGAGGLVEDRLIDLDGVVSGRGLTFKAGGLSGAFGRDTVEIDGPGLEVKAHRSSLGAYQAAVAALQAKATTERLAAEQAQDQQAEAAAPAVDLGGAGDKAAKLRAAAADLASAAAQLEAGIAAAPDYGRQSTDNTAQISRMADRAAGVSGAERSQLLASANQLIVGTNQLDVARTQYALGLNRIVHRGAPLALSVEQFCASPAAAGFADPCAQAQAAGTAFDRALAHASVVFKGAKQTIQSELQRQNELARKLGG